MGDVGEVFGLDAAPVATDAAAAGPSATSEHDTLNAIADQHIDKEMRMVFGMETPHAVTREAPPAATTPATAAVSKQLDQLFQSPGHPPAADLTITSVKVEPPAAPPARPEPTPVRRRARGMSEHTSPSRQLMTPPVHIRIDALGDGTVLPPKSGPEIPVAGRPSELPKVLQMPMSMRCDFCIRIDSLCFNCHKKWKVALQARRANIAEVMRQLPDQAFSILTQATAAKGSLEFLGILQMSYANQPLKVTGSAGHFCPLPADRLPNGTHLQQAGNVYPLHIACAYQRKDVAKELLKLPGALRRSSENIYPTHFLPIPLEESWEAILDAAPQYKEHVLNEQAKNLRALNKMADAEAIYDKILEMNPRNERAVCGKAKMAFDQGQFQLCIQRCKSILSTPIVWAEFTPPVLESLLHHATEQHHATSHKKDGAALKPCGCIITERVRLRVRRLKWEFFSTHVLPFIPGADIYILWQALRHIQEANVGLNRYFADLSVASPRLCDDVFVQDPLFRGVVDAIDKDLPKPDGKTIAAPVTLQGVQVVAAADFLMLILRAVAEAAVPPPTKKPGFFDRFTKKDIAAPERRFYRKDYRAYRPSPHAPWVCTAVGEWEPATVVLGPAAAAAVPRSK